jgi:hypothetical protein
MKEPKWQGPEIPENLKALGQNPEAALDQTEFADSAGVGLYMESYGAWSFGAGTDLLLRASAVGHQLVDRVELAEAAVYPDLRVWALKHEGAALRQKGDFPESRAKYADALRIFHAAGLGDLTGFARALEQRRRIDEG